MLYSIDPAMYQLLSGLLYHINLIVLVHISISIIDCKHSLINCKGASIDFKVGGGAENLYFCSYILTGDLPQKTLLFVWGIFLNTVFI